MEWLVLQEIIFCLMFLCLFFLISWYLYYTFRNKNDIGISVNQIEISLISRRRDPETPPPAYEEADKTRGLRHRNSKDSNFNINVNKEDAGASTSQSSRESKANLSVDDDANVKSYDDAVQYKNEVETGVVDPRNRSNESLNEPRDANLTSSIEIANKDSIDRSPGKKEVSVLIKYYNSRYSLETKNDSLTSNAPNVHTKDSTVQSNSEKNKDVVRKDNQSENCNDDSTDKVVQSSTENETNLGFEEDKSKILKNESKNNSLSCLDLGDVKKDTQVKSNKADDSYNASNDSKLNFSISPKGDNGKNSNKSEDANVTTDSTNMNISSNSEKESNGKNVESKDLNEPLSNNFSSVNVRNNVGDENSKNKNESNNVNLPSGHANVDNICTSVILSSEAKTRSLMAINVTNKDSKEGKDALTSADVINEYIKEKIKVYMNEFKDIGLTSINEDDGTKDKSVQCNVEVETDNTYESSYIIKYSNVSKDDDLTSTDVCIEVTAKSKTDKELLNDKVTQTEEDISRIVVDNEITVKEYVTQLNNKEDSTNKKFVQDSIHTESSNNDGESGNTKENILNTEEQKGGKENIDGESTSEEKICHDEEKDNRNENDKKIDDDDARESVSDRGDQFHRGDDNASGDRGVTNL